MNERSPNTIALREFRDSVRILELQDPEENPNLFLFLRFLELFQEFHLPVEHVGKLRLNVTEEFFEDKKLANEIIVSMVRHFKNGYNLILERVNNEVVASQIFGDWLSVHKYCGILWYDGIEDDFGFEDDNSDDSD